MSKGKNRPVLQQVESEGKSKGITMKQAQKLGFSYLSAPLYESKLKFNAARVEESLQKSLQHHDLGIRLWRFAGMGSKEDKVLKEGQVWYVSITYIIMGEVGDEVTMEKHQSKTQGKEIERVKTVRVNDGPKMKLLKIIHYAPIMSLTFLCERSYLFQCGLVVKSCVYTSMNSD